MPLNLIFIQPGNYSIEDDGIPGNNISVIKDGNGVVIFTFAHPADGLGFTVSTPGVNITVNFTDSMGAANFTIGDLTDPTKTPDSVVMKNIVTTGTVTLVANGTITEGGSDAAADITAGAVILSAGTGIGTAGNAIETRTGLFEAETNTGGIAISNVGSVQIGGISPDVDGLDVTTGGDISFTTVGSIFLTEANTVTAAEVVHGGSSFGNITLTALGANADIIGNVDNGAATASRGSISFTAGRDIQLGTIGSDFNNDVISNGALTLVAGRDILIDGFADVLSDNFGLNNGSNLVLTSGRNIGILNVAGTSASVTASGSGGGDAIITTGQGGSLTVNGPGSFGLGSTSGDVIVNADRILINGASGISAPSGQIFINPRTLGRTIDLGSVTDAAQAIELSNAELGRLFTPTLRIGDGNTGSLNVTAAISMTNAGNASTLIMRSGTDILFGPAGAFTLNGGLLLRGGDNVFAATGSSINATFVDVLVDEFGDDGNTGGFATLNGTVTSASVIINGNAENDTLIGSNANETIVGNGGNDILKGGGGNDTLDGGAGTDVMYGGIGNDFFFVDNAGDTVIEAGAEGIDRVFAGVSFILGVGQSIETLSTDNQSGTATIDLTGNQFAQTIFGNNGINTLDSGGGGDAMFGLGGNDAYIIRSSGDRAIEAVGAGMDRVFAAVNFTLEAGSEVEMITTTDNNGGASINLTGNLLTQAIFGNAGNNTLDSGGGGDTMVGFGGNDFYFIRTGADRAVEAIGGGIDRVFAGVSFVLEAGSEVETLSTVDNAATTAIDLTGNVFAQTLFGNAGANVLDGKDGIDTLFGFGGADTFAFTSTPGVGNVDLVSDFVAGVDKIALENAIFIGLAAGALPAGAFVIGTAAGDADDRIIYNNATGALLFDADGSAGGAAVQFATLQGAPAISATDFVVI